MFLEPALTSFQLAPRLGVGGSNRRRPPSLASAASASSLDPPPAGGWASSPRRRARDELRQRWRVQGWWQRGVQASAAEQGRGGGLGGAGALLGRRRIAGFLD